MEPTTAAAMMVHSTIIITSLDWMENRESSRRRGSRLNRLRLEAVGVDRCAGSVALAGGSVTAASSSDDCSIGFLLSVAPRRSRSRLA